MRIEEALQIALFENFKDFERVYNEALDILKDNNVSFNAIDFVKKEISDKRNKAGIESDSVVDIYAELFRKNVALFFQDMVGGPIKKIDRNTANVNNLIRRFKESFDDPVQLKRTVLWFLGIIDGTLSNLEEQGDKDAFEILHKDSDWILFQPEAKAASCRLGSGTRWCISSKGNNNLFNQTSERNDVFIIHTNNEKYAIVVTKDGNRVVEVQDNNNDRSHNPNPLDIVQFMAEIERDDVDIDLLFEILGLNRIKYHPDEQLEEF